MEKNVILYTIHCPRCKVLAKKLEQKGIEFEECTDIEIMKDKGFLSSPMLEIDGKLYDFSEAISWLKEK